MKILFFIITALGLSYLLVSSLDAETFSFVPKQTVTEAAPNVDDAKDAGQIAKLMEDIEAISLSQRSLQKAFESASVKNSQLVQELASVSTTHSQLQHVVDEIDEKVSKEPEHAKVLAMPKGIELDPAPIMKSALSFEAVQAQTTNSLLAEASVDQPQDSEVQKRMRQQALLRDLAQKRQFAAISSLQTVSGK